jgi:type IV pilus assembly protein PilA
MNCPYCGQSIPDDIVFCPKCGTRMGSPLPDSPAYQTPLPAGFVPPTSGKAIGSLICGIFVFFLPASILAIVLGHLSISEIRKSAGRMKGEGIATAGLILGYLGVVLIPFILIIAAIAIPNLLRAKMAANEASAVGTLRTMNTAIDAYAEKCPDQGYPSSIERLGPGPGDCTGAGLVSNILATPNAKNSGYIFFYQPASPNAKGKTTSYGIYADPMVPTSTGTRHFYTDDSGIIREERSKSAGPNSTPL